MDTTSIMQDAEEQMKMTIEFLQETFSRIRAGRANTHILDGIRVDYYGSVVPLSNVATVTTPDAKTIMIQPWEKQMLKVVEKAIMDSDVGITPENNGEVIRLGIPPLTEERRKQLVKQTKQEGEDAKISIRNARREGIDGVKKAVKNGLPEDAGKSAEEDLQKLHDRFIKQIDDLFVEKEKEILSLQSKLAQTAFSAKMNALEEVNGVKFLTAVLPETSPAALRELVDQFRQKNPSAVIALGSATDGKPALIAAVSADLIARGLSAGDLIKQLATAIGGGGGGRPDLAQAGGKDPSKLSEALSLVRKYIMDRTA